MASQDIGVVVPCFGVFTGLFKSLFEDINGLLFIVTDVIGIGRGGFGHQCRAGRPQLLPGMPGFGKIPLVIAGPASDEFLLLFCLQPVHVARPRHQVRRV